MRPFLKRLLPQPARRLLRRFFPAKATVNPSEEWLARLSELEMAVRRLEELVPKESEGADRLSDRETASCQLESILHYEHGIAPPPPKHLQARVVGLYSPEFISSGYDTCQELNKYLTSFGMKLQDFNAILDFGCGCGRVIRALRTLLPSHELNGTDIDQEAIQWLREHYESVATFDLNPHLPPMRYPDDKFDLIYSISIFTHLPEDMQFAWLGELQRVTRPGAILLLTTHGEEHYRKLPRPALVAMEQNGFYYLQAGRTQGLPEFYQVAFHSHDYVRQQWSSYFDILDIKSKGLQHQDIVLLRKRSA